MRVRQIKVLGEMEGQDTLIPVKKAAVDMQQENCESETLRVFRMLTSQVNASVQISLLNKERQDGPTGCQHASLKLPNYAAGKTRLEF